jgi:hypothetical protein
MSQVQSSTSASYAAQWQYLQALQSQQTNSADASTASTSATQPFDPFAGLGGDPSQSSGGAGPCPPFSLDTMSALINAQAQSGTSVLSSQQQKVFGELDTDGDGKITGDELKADFGPQNSKAADYVMGKLDKDGDGSVSADEFGAGTTRTAHRHHMHAGPPPGQGSQDPLAQLLSADGANSTSSANSDGTSTTTITYADGSKVSMTSAPSSSGWSGRATSDSTQQNLLEQLIKMQSQLLQVTSTTSATSSLATI